MELSIAAEAANALIAYHELEDEIRAFHDYVRTYQQFVGVYRDLLFSPREKLSAKDQESYDMVYSVYQNQKKKVEALHAMAKKLSDMGLRGKVIAEAKKTNISVILRNVCVK